MTNFFFLGFFGRQAQFLTIESLKWWYYTSTMFLYRRRREWESEREREGDRQWRYNRNKRSVKWCGLGSYTHRANPQHTQIPATTPSHIRYNYEFKHTIVWLVWQLWQHRENGICEVKCKWKCSIVVLLHFETGWNCKRSSRIGLVRAQTGENISGPDAQGFFFLVFWSSDSRSL